MILATSRTSWFSREVLKRCTLSILLGILFAWALYALFGYGVIKALYNGDAPAFLGKFMAGRSTTPLVSYLREADRMMIENTFRASALLLFLLLLRVNRMAPVYVCVFALLLILVSFGCI